MSFQVRLAADASRRIQSWALPDAVMVDVRLRLRRLADDPAGQLFRAEEPFDGLVLYFDLIDPANRLHRYHFVFQCVYGPDEQTVLVTDGACLRDFV